jgi:hypothetical protein
MATSCAPLIARGFYDWAVATALAVATLVACTAALVLEAAWETGRPTEGRHVVESPPPT